jgi:hypothetical protein
MSIYAPLYALIIIVGLLMFAGFALFSVYYAGGYLIDLFAGF